eukprot:gene12100-25383_t
MEYLKIFIGSIIITGLILNFLPVIMGSTLKDEGDFPPYVTDLSSQAFNGAVIASVVSCLPIIFDYLIDLLKHDYKYLWMTSMPRRDTFLALAILDLFILLYILPFENYDLLSDHSIWNKSQLLLVGLCFTVDWFPIFIPNLSSDPEWSLFMGNKYLILYFSVAAACTIILTVLTTRIARAETAETKNIDEMMVSADTALCILNDMLTYDKLQTDPLRLQLQLVSPWPIISDTIASMFIQVCQYVEVEVEPFHSSINLILPEVTDVDVLTRTPEQQHLQQQQQYPQHLQHHQYQHQYFNRLSSLVFGESMRGGALSYASRGGRMSSLVDTSIPNMLRMRVKDFGVGIST